MPYTPPGNDAVSFPLTAYTPTVINGVNAALAEHAIPENDEADFLLAVYSVREANGINFDLTGEAPTYYGILKRWNGASFVKEPLKIFTGSGWQSKPLKQWSGTDWLLIDTTGI